MIKLIFIYLTVFHTVFCKDLHARRRSNEAERLGELLVVLIWFNEFYVGFSPIPFDSYGKVGDNIFLPLYFYFVSLCLHKLKILQLHVQYIIFIHNLKC